MSFYLGIDLGSTTTKAILLDDDGKIVGRGLTNTRSNYEVATAVARNEALLDARLSFLRSEVEAAAPGRWTELESVLVDGFRLEQFLYRLERLRDVLGEVLSEERFAAVAADAKAAIDGILYRIRQDAEDGTAGGATDRSRFFRDVVGARYMHLAEERSRAGDGVTFEVLMAAWDKAILREENQVLDLPFADGMKGSLARAQPDDAVAGAVDRAAARDLTVANTVGTGYGRQRLPFRKDQIRSEILCHGLGAHTFFPNTRTVLDIGGQDTKAIQVDDRGIVTSFQMNDRCAAGCGRYLGYIADELSLGLHELGPLAMKANRPVRINSTCTVFAGAELRDRLSVGQNREDILAGLHRAIILRAMSLLARSGGVDDEFTFTGGVARNEAAVKALRDLTVENYGEDITLNIHPDSIYTGAVGAALYARRAVGSAAGAA